MQSFFSKISSSQPRSIFVMGLVLGWVGIAAVAVAVAWPRQSMLPDGTVLHEPLPAGPSDTGGLQAGNTDEPVFVYDGDDEEPNRALLGENGSNGAEAAAREGAPAGEPRPAGNPTDGQPGTGKSGTGGSDGPNESASEEDQDLSGEVIYSAEGPNEAGERPTTADDKTPLDRNTEKEGMLRYHMVFDPTVVPFKRNLAKDRVLDDVALVVGAPAAKPLPMSGSVTSPSRQTFWASLLVELKPDIPVPIPSVSPQSQILEGYTTPTVSKLVFLKDGADNYYVMADASGRFRLQFLMDAPVHYFGRELPRGLSLAESRKSFRGFFEPPSPSVVAKAKRVWTKIGVSPQMNLDQVLSGLVGWFRAFTPADPPPDTGDVYVDISLGQVGICRHRSHAFVVTAQALGIPARYVSNEAHVFVEVWIGGDNPGWLRIDLGGGAEGLQVLGEEDRVRHNPPGSDPFAAGSRGNGFGGSHIAGADDVFGLPSMEPARDQPGTDLPGGALPWETAISSGGKGEALPASGGSRGGLLPTFTRILHAEPSLFRGETTVVDGELVGLDGVGIGNMPIQVRLLGVTHGTDDRELGATRTDSSGKFKARVHIPGEIGVGRYQLLVDSPGNAVYAPSITR